MSEKMYNPQFQLPKDEKTKKIIEDSSDVAFNELKAQGILLPDPVEAPEIIANIAEVYITSLIEHVAKEAVKEKGGINFEVGKLFTIRSSVRPSEKGEKAGNICVILEPGPITKKAFKNDDATEEADEE